MILQMRLNLMVRFTDQELWTNRSSLLVLSHSRAWKNATNSCQKRSVHIKFLEPKFSDVDYLLLWCSLFIEEMTSEYINTRFSEGVICSWRIARC